MEKKKRKRKKKKEEKVGGWEVFDFLFGLRQKRRTKGGLYLYGKKTRLLFVYFTMSRPEAASAVSRPKSLVTVRRILRYKRYSQLWLLV